MFRLARADDLAYLPDIERAAGEAFRQINMGAVADDDPPTIEEPPSSRRTGETGLPPMTLTTQWDTSWWRRSTGMRMSSKCQSTHSTRGNGSEAATGPSRAVGTPVRLPAMKLTTFADVPWNAPYYQRLG